MELNAWEEKWLVEKEMEELDFTSEKINDQACATTKMKWKTKLVKKQSEKERKCKIRFDSDWRRSSKAKTKEKKISNIRG